MDLASTHAVELGWLLGLVTFLILWIYSYSLSLSSRPGVPKGRFWQIPYVGETLTLPSKSFEDFLRPRIQRYGRNFRTHLFGAPCICVSSFDTMRFVLQSPHTFKRILPKVARDLVSGGDTANEFVLKRGGVIHKALASSDNLRRLIPELDKRCKDMLASWERMETVPYLEELEKYVFIAASHLNCDYLLSEATADKIHRWFYEIRNGMLEVPVNIPGTPYHRVLRTRKHLDKVFLTYVTRRRAEKGLVPHHDLLESLLQAGQVLTDSELAESLIGFVFAALESTGIALAWTLMELMTRPDLVALLREENDRLAEERRRRPDSTITLEDIFEKLTLTNQVLQETLRLRNIAAFSFRQATEDVVHDGIFFPKGWNVLVSWVPQHKDPNNHSNPDEFDPSRFVSESASKMNNFMPFSSGQHYCKGKEAFKVEAAIFLHHLLVDYDFKTTGKADTLCSDMIYWPTPRPRVLVPITVSKRWPQAKSSQ